MDSADDELMVRYLEGAATPGEVTALEARLAGDHQARREFVRLAHLQALFIDLPRAPAAALQRRSWRWPLVLLGSAAALVLIGMLWHRQPAGPAGPAITAVSGTVHCLRAGIEVDVRAGDALHAGDRLSVDAASQLSFSWRDRVAIRLAEQSEATVGGPSQATITLAQGDIHALTSPIPGLAFTIATPEGLATDIGTEFTVHRDALGTRVRVDRGQVRFSNASGQLSIAAGASARIAPGGAPQADPAGTSSSAGGPAATVPASDDGDGPHLTASGVVTQVDAKRRSFTLIDAATGASSEYRAYFAGGHTQAMLARIATLSVGDSLTVTYLEREGRRALAITPMARSAGP